MKKKVKIIILILIIVGILCGSLALIFRKQNTLISKEESYTMLQGYEECISAFKILYNGNYVEDISKMNVYGTEYSQKLNYVSVGTKIDNQVIYCLYKCDTQEFTYKYNWANFQEQIGNKDNEEISFSKPEIDYMIECAQGTATKDSFNKMVITSIDKDIKYLRTIYEDINDIFADYYTMGNTLNVMISKYYKSNSLLPNSSSNLYESLQLRKRIDEEMNYISNKDLIELYASYKELSNVVTNYPEGYSYATYLPSMREKYEKCSELLTKVQLNYK